ncbi:MAG: hypothetical protein M1823_006096 [Watsoniomyces obsoletus]|nr:MAG: hypothetical protein M1823_006096 [Watsoniomyces obsoletus]
MSLFSVTALLALVASAAAADFDASASTNLAVYWGQGPNQARLAEICAKSSADVIPIGFLNVFPDQGLGGYPGVNFGNACGAGVFKNEQGVDTQLLSGCTQIAEDIPKCQALGKKILLSIGGAVPDTYRINSDESAVKFADFVWKAFGPKVTPDAGPRPFGDAVVDGFDFDIEHNGPGGYAAMVTRLRELYKTDSSKKYYTSTAPQCVVPDKQLADAIQKSYFDFIWVQFYNTPGCSARDYISGTGKFTFDDYVTAVASSTNPDAKVFIGLPASTAAVFTPEFYLNPQEAAKIVTDFKNKYPRQFGGVMLWEATASEKNQINGKSFGDTIKDVLLGQGIPRGLNGTQGFNSTEGFNGTSPGTATPSTGAGLPIKQEGGVGDVTPSPTPTPSPTLTPSPTTTPPPTSTPSTSTPTPTSTRLPHPDVSINVEYLERKNNPPSSETSQEETQDPIKSEDKKGGYKGRNTPRKRYNESKKQPRSLSNNGQYRRYQGPRRRA